MKKFIKKTIYISLPIIVVAIIMEILLRFIPNDYLYKKQYLDENSNEIQTLILGSSHTFRGLNPKYFESNTFNAGYISQSLKYDFEILKKYKDRFEQLKNIILPISYPSLFAKLEDFPESWRVKNYMIYYDLNTSTSLVDYSEILSNRFSVNFKRIYSYYLFGKSNRSCTDVGWGKGFNSKNTKDLAKTGKASAKLHTIGNINSDKRQQIFQENLLILESMIQWSRKNNVKIFLFTPPAYETYRQNINQEQLKISIDTTQDICSKYDNCFYENLFDDTNFLSTDFHDAHHLSKTGAKKLSVLMNEKISK